MGSSQCWRNCGWQRLAYERHAIALLDPPSRQAVQRRWSQGRARAQAEARVMPGAAHGIVNQETLDQRPAIVSARRADRKQPFNPANEQRRFARNMPEQHLAIGQPVQQHALSEVRTVRR